MTQIKSDGSSSSYYALTITNKAGQSIDVETGDIIRALVGNDFDLSNIVKACRRMYEASQGRGKEGSSIEYDANKIVYFAKEFAHWNCADKSVKEPEVDILSRRGLNKIGLSAEPTSSYLITDPELMKKLQEAIPRNNCKKCDGVGYLFSAYVDKQYDCPNCKGTGKC